MVINDKPITETSKICTELNKYFCSIGHKMIESTYKNSTASHPFTFYGKRISNSIFLEPTNCDEIINIIDGLNPNKASGYDDIPTKLIKAAKHSLAPILTNIFNSCLEKGQYLDELKIARVTPLHKGGSKTDLKNYRPISILSAFNKTFEIIIKWRLVNFWKKHDVIVPSQFGFCENYSTTLAIA